MFERDRETQTGEPWHVNLEGFKEEGGWGAGDGGVHWHVDMGGSKGGGAKWGEEGGPWHLGMSTQKAPLV